MAILSDNVAMGQLLEVYFNHHGQNVLLLASLDEKSAELALAGTTSAPDLIVVYFSSYDHAQGKADDILSRRPKHTRLLYWSQASLPLTGRRIAISNANGAICGVNGGDLVQFADAIRAVMDEKNFFPDALVGELLNQIRHHDPGLLREVVAGGFHLTRREVEILRLIAQDQSNDQIARSLRRSIYTIKNQVHDIMTKLGASSRHDAVFIARENHLLE